MSEKLPQLSLIFLTGLASTFGCTNSEVAQKPSEITPPSTTRRIIPTPTPSRIVINWRIAAANNPSSACYEIIFPAKQFPNETASYIDSTKNLEYNTQLGVLAERLSSSDLRYQFAVGRIQGASWPESAGSIVAHEINFNDIISTKACYKNWGLETIEINGQQITAP